MKFGFEFGGGGMLDKLSPRLKMHEQTWPCLCALLMCVFMCDRARRVRPVAVNCASLRQLRLFAVYKLIIIRSRLLLQGFSVENIAWDDEPPPERVNRLLQIVKQYLERSACTHTLTAWLLGGEDINYVGRL